jgi:uncharacterized membrane protein (DUF2068 family)
LLFGGESVSNSKCCSECAGNGKLAHLRKDFDAVPGVGSPNMSGHLQVSRGVASKVLVSREMGLRPVAVLEAAKGLLGLGIAVLFLRVGHQNLDMWADRLTRILHINPEGRLSDFIYAAASSLSIRSRQMLIAGLAFVYAILRFAEAYGLWHARVWAEWIALVSGCIYLPWEIYTLVRHPHLYKVGILVLNLLIIFYMLYLRLRPSEEPLRT